MNDFKVGDTCWTWSITVYGSYVPYFSQYKITNIIHQEKISFVCLSHDHQVDMAMPLDLIFKSKNEAIDSLITLLKELRDE